MTTVENLTVRAHEMGSEYGKSLGSWVIDGNSSKAYCQRIIDGYDDGDPEIMDMCPSPLSGEWADAPTVFSVLKDLGFDPYIQNAIPVLDSYEDGFIGSWWDTVIQAAYAMHGEYEPCGVCGEYGHKSKDHCC